MRRTDPILKDECERLMSQVFSHGDKGRIAQRLGVSLSEVSQQINPEEQRLSDFYRCAEFLRAVRYENPVAAQTLAEFLQFIAGGEVVHASLPKLTGELAKESSEFLCAHLEQRSMHVQRKECLDVRRVADRILARMSETDRKGNEKSTGRVTGRLRKTG